jgi:hypothetical protein
MFRFDLDDLRRLLPLLRLPAVIVATENRTRASSEEALLITLRRLAWPLRLCDLESQFDRSAQLGRKQKAKWRKCEATGRCSVWHMLSNEIQTRFRGALFVPANNGCEEMVQGDGDLPR